MPTNKDLPDPDALWQLSRRATAGTRFKAIAMLVIVASLTAITIDAIGPAALDGPAATFANFMYSAPGFPQALVFIAIGAIPVVIVHELGHAIAARRLLGTAVSIVIGTTGNLGQVRLGQITMSLNALSSPARTAGSATFDADRAGARDILLIALAGPAASAIGLVLSIVALTAGPSDGVAHHLIWATVGTGGLCVLNVIPFVIQDRRHGPRQQSDGRLALDAARTLHALR